MFAWRNRGAEETEGAQRTEVRLRRVEEEVRALAGAVQALQDRQLAYTASIAEATDKLHRLVERGRKYAEHRRRNGDAGDEPEPGADGGLSDAFLDVWRDRGGLGGSRSP